jgi:hypothetical protein
LRLVRGTTVYVTTPTDEVIGVEAALSDRIGDIKVTIEQDEGAHSAGASSGMFCDKVCD